MKVAVVVGARPNFMKAAPVLAALETRGMRTALVHTGQHYDENMSAAFLRDLSLRAPDAALEVGSGSHATQTAQVLLRFEAWLKARPQDLVVVVGDVNSTLAAALAATKLEVPVAHVEAGLRSFDRHMPEELNRRLTDCLAALCFVTEPSGVEHLRHEGIEERRIHLVGNTMIDTLRRLEDVAARRPLPGTLPERFGLVTLHRPSNVDRGAVLAGILEAFAALAGDLPLVWPLHPRTRHRIEGFGLGERLSAIRGLQVCEPLGYLDFLARMRRARLVLTDSGGIQEEALVLRVPVVTLRENTERPITVECGGNLLVGADPEQIHAGARTMLARDPASFRLPELWDGQAGARVADRIERFAAAGGWL